MATSRTIERTVRVVRDPGGSRRRRLGVAMVVLLLVQAVLGVGNELWTSLPASGDPFTGATPVWLLSAHVLVGTTVVVVAVVLLVSARRARDRAWTVPSLLGLLAVTGAWASGHFFLVTFGDDALSLSMAVLAMAAVGAYVAGLVRAGASSAGAPGASSEEQPWDGVAR